MKNKTDEAIDTLHSNFNRNASFNTFSFSVPCDTVFTDKTYGWTIEMQIKVLKHKMSYSEVPVNYKKRIGVSKVSGTVKGTILAGIKIIFAVFKYLF